MWRFLLGHIHSSAQTTCSSKKFRIMLVSVDLLQTDWFCSMVSQRWLLITDWLIHLQCVWSGTGGLCGLRCPLEAAGEPWSQLVSLLQSLDAAATLPHCGQSVEKPGEAMMSPLTCNDVTIFSALIDWQVSRFFQLIDSDVIVRVESAVSGSCGTITATSNLSDEVSGDITAERRRELWRRAHDRPECRDVRIVYINTFF